MTDRAGQAKVQAGMIGILNGTTTADAVLEDLRAGGHIPEESDAAHEATYHAVMDMTDAELDAWASGEESPEMTTKTENQKISTAVQGRAKSRREKARSERQDPIMAGIAAATADLAAGGPGEATVNLGTGEIVTPETPEAPETQEPEPVASPEIQDPQAPEERDPESPDAEAPEEVEQSSLKVARIAARAKWQRAAWAVMRAEEAEQRIEAVREKDPKSVKAADLKIAQDLVKTRTKTAQDLRKEYEEAQAREKSAK